MSNDNSEVNCKSNGRAQDRSAFIKLLKVIMVNLPFMGVGDLIICTKHIIVSFTKGAIGMPLPFL